MKIPVALEIGEQYLKLLTARPLGRLRRLGDCVVKPVFGLNDGQISELLSRTLKELKVVPRPLAVSIPRNQVTVRNLHLPSQDKKEIAQILELHIGRIVPYRKEEIVYSYMFIGIDELNYARVLLAIVHKDILRKQIKIAESAGFYIDGFNLSSYGIWQWVSSVRKTEINSSDLYLLLDVDASFTDFIIFNKDNLFFSRGITMEARDKFTEQETAKLIGEIKQSLVIFNSEETNKKPAKIFLSGGGIIDSFRKAVEKEFDIPILSVAPVYSTGIAKPQKAIIPDNSSISALSDLLVEENNRKISFVLPEMQIRKSLNEKTRQITILGTAVIYLFAVTVVFFIGKFYNQQSYLARLDQRIKSIKQDIGDLLAQHKKMEIVKGFLNERRGPLIIISELEKTVPSEISVASLSIDEQNNVDLRGQAAQLSDVIKFITAIENTGYFGDVSTKSTRTRKLKERLVTDFEIVFKFSVQTDNTEKKEPQPKTGK